ncbi:hypothetical protein BGZ98_003338 [Dissophora globulifera]|nr:hypothetical protein BGZ98_003338 [Dissophora globulifera]
MLSLIRATAYPRLPPGIRSLRPGRRLSTLHSLAAAPDRRVKSCLIARGSSARASLHHSSRAASADHSASSPSSNPSSPANDAPPKAQDSSGTSNGSGNNNSSTIDAPSSNTSRQSSTAAAKRRLRSHRGSAKAAGRTTFAGDSTSRVYVPFVPQSFLTTHYHPVSSNTYDIAAIPYHVHPGILAELQNTMASCLLTPSTPQSHIHRMPARFNNIILSSPSEGSSRMLETLTMATAKTIDADVLAVDLQDLMELTADIFNIKGAGNPWPVDHLSRGFNPFVAAPVPPEFMEDTMDDADDDFDEEDDDDEDRERSTIFVDARLYSAKARGSRLSSASSSVALKEKFEQFWTSLLLSQPTSLTAREKSLPKILYLKDIADVILTPFGHMLLPSLASAVLTLRKAGHNIMVVAGHAPSLLTTKQQYDDEMTDENRSSSGAVTLEDGEAGAKNVSLITILQKLHSPEGQGGHPSSLQYAQISLSSLTYDVFPGPTQTFHHISVPPYLAPPTSSGSTDATLLADRQMQQQYALENAQLMKQDKAFRIKEVNCRNMAAVLRFRGGLLAGTETPMDVFGALNGIDAEVWGFGKVYRIITNALGALYRSEIERTGSVSKTATLSQDHLKDALETSNNNVKLRRMVAADLGGKKAAAAEVKPLVRMEDCNRYERKLLGSLVDPDKIKTTFKNTIIPPETIHTLQTMITLPLVRPQLFSYGLLQNEFLSGLLLFGPPGTGKTLLAKAVAKESGARMLEIKASDIFDMYVGEGEKNVSAVFSLARKLSPCVIFLDEVDSIFRVRGSAGGGGAGSGGGNSSQREILNQFMVEWDGLRSSGQNHGIVVMASTNRPFELDDAVLRRLPRRILVDLPSEQAREQILNVYLSQEQLEEGIDVKELAKNTAFYSGSDLKNLCVSAVLASVREDVECEIRRMQPADELSDDKDDGVKGKDKVFDLSPLLNEYKKEALGSLGAAETQETRAMPVRVIRKRHFDKALAQITPSCSENMDSLTELRKWDGLYGDGGKGRRKVSKGIGFEVETLEPSATAARGRT